MQINPEGLTAVGYVLAAGGVVLTIIGLFLKRRLDWLTAQIDAAKEAERLKKSA